VSVVGHSDGVVVLLGLAAATAWGVADFFGARAAKAEDASEAAAAVQLVGACVYVIAYLALGDLTPSLDLIGVAYAAAGGMLFGLGLITLFKALDAGPVSVVSPIGSAYPLVTTLVVIALFGSRPTGAQLAGIALVVIGIVVCSGIAGAARSDVRLTRGVRLGAATLVLWGIAFAVIDQGVDRLGWKTASLAQLLAAAATCWAALRLRGHRTRYAPLLRNSLVLVAGVLIVTGDLALNLGLSGDGDAGPVIATAISACYPVLTVLLAVRHFGEKVMAIPLTGAAIAIAGVIALSAGG
jgi:drug/metabolite transporter (DMT)-like permease